MTSDSVLFSTAKDIFELLNETLLPLNLDLEDKEFLAQEELASLNVLFLTLVAVVVVQSSASSSLTSAVGFFFGFVPLRRLDDTLEDFIDPSPASVNINFMAILGVTVLACGPIYWVFDNVQN